MTVDEGGAASGAGRNGVSVTVAQAQFVQVTGLPDAVNTAIELLNQLPNGFQKVNVHIFDQVEAHERDSSMVKVRRKEDADAARSFPIVRMMKGDAALLVDALKRIMSQEL